MAFEAGNISFRRFAIGGNIPADATAILEAASKHLFATSEAPEEVEYGWSGARHVYDAELTHDACVFNDAVHFALRIDTNRVPTTIKRAYTAIEEAAVAATNPSGFISKAQRRAVRDVVAAKLEEEVKAGKHRRSKIVPVLWDIKTGELYANATGATLEKLWEIFERTFERPLTAMTAGAIAAHARGEEKIDRLRATRFVLGVNGESGQPDYPWVARGADAKGFLGNEFLTWLWWAAMTGSGVFSTLSGEIAVLFDKTLDMECAYGEGGKEQLRCDGTDRAPEAFAGLRAGKVPRKAGMIIDVKGDAFAIVLNGELMSFGSARLPEVEGADTGRVIFEERIALLRTLISGMESLFKIFLADRVDPGSWDMAVSKITRWLSSWKSGKPTPELAAV